MALGGDEVEVLVPPGPGGQGRGEELEVLRRRVVQVEGHPPYWSSGGGKSQLDELPDLNEKKKNYFVVILLIFL